MEKRHVEHLGKKSLDRENRLQVIYRILKDTLRHHKRQLLQIKRQKAYEHKRALEMQRKIEKAKEKKDEKCISDNLKKVTGSDGSAAFKFIGSQKHLTPKLKAIIANLLSKPMRKHNKYCPCCRNYDEGEEPSLEQMGEFLEFIRQQHIKTAGKNKDLMKRMKPRDETLDYDSISDVTDLSNEDILATSK